MGKSRWQAAADGTTEVWGALLASTVTTIAVFLPILFVKEQAGQLFQDIAIAISSAIAISLVVSVTVIPTIVARILKVSGKLHGRRRTSASWLGRIRNTVSPAFVDYVNARPPAPTRDYRRHRALFPWGLTLSHAARRRVSSQRQPEPRLRLHAPAAGIQSRRNGHAGQTIENQNSARCGKPAKPTADTLPGGGIDNFFFVALRNQAFFGMAARDAGAGPRTGAGRQQGDLLHPRHDRVRQSVLALRTGIRRHALGAYRCHRSGTDQGPAVSPDVSSARLARCCPARTPARYLVSTSATPRCASIPTGSAPPMSA